jgi:hypothetical protein
VLSASLEVIETVGSIVVLHCPNPLKEVSVIRKMSKKPESKRSPIIEKLY